MNNWVLESLLRALQIWAEKMQEIWTLLTTSPQSFRGGTIWSIISGIHGGMKSIAYALLVLFFVVGVARTTTNFNEIKRPEQALKLFLRFAIAKGVVTYSMDILLAIFKIIQGIINNIAGHMGNILTQGVTLPDVIQQKILECGFFESIPLWIVGLISCLLVWVLSFVMILTV